MSRGNSFTSLRLLFALAVVFAHSFPLGGFGDDPLSRMTGGQAQIGALAVFGFFVISGFLIAGSAARQPLWRFAVNRTARILPGFWAVQMLTVFVLVPAIIVPRSGGATGYWESIGQGPYSALSYLLLNADFRILQYPIGDLFLDNPGGPAVNGSLWSLAPEVACYLYLGLLALLGGLRWKMTGPLLFAITFALHLTCLRQPELAVKVAGMLEHGWIHSFELPLVRSVFLAFLAGLTCYQFREVLRWRGWMAALAGFVLVAGCWGQVFPYVWPFALPYLVLYLAHRLPFERVEQWGDFSYGIYIYAFPIQQCLALAGLPRFGFLPYLAASIGLSVAAGVASWRWIERPVLEWARALGRTRPPGVLLVEPVRQLELFGQESGPIGRRSVVP